MPLNPQNAQNCSLEICIVVSHLTFVHVSIHKGPSSGNQIKATLHKTILATFIHS